MTEPEPIIPQARPGEMDERPIEAIQMAAKDFDSIASDYAFFMAHATEAESDVTEYARVLAGFAEGRTLIRMLDFGCGTGDFSRRLISTLNWPPQLLRMTLVEPVAGEARLDDQAGESRRTAAVADASVPYFGEG